MNLLHQATPTVRKHWEFRLHVWLGVLLLIPVTLVALSGVGLAFAREFERVLAPDLWTVSAVGEGQAISPAGVVRFIHKWRADDHLLVLEMPDRPQDTIVATVKNPQGVEREIFIDPYRQYIVGQRLANDDPLYWLGRFHRSLGVGLPGLVVVALSSIGVFMLFIFGWLSRRHRSGRLHVTLHIRIVSIAAWIWLVCATTGVMAVVAGVSLNPLQPPNKALFRAPLDITGICDGQRIDKVWWREDGTTVAQCTAPGSVGPFGQSYRNGSQEPVNLSLGDWLATLHTGIVLGIGGRVIWFWGVLILPIAMLSGLLAWQKRVRNPNINPQPE